MSFSRSPRHNDIRRREDSADRRKVVNIICAFVALAAFALVASIVFKTWG